MILKHLNRNIYLIKLTKKWHNKKKKKEKKREGGSDKGYRWKDSTGHSHWRKSLTYCGYLFSENKNNCKKGKLNSVWLGVISNKQQVSPALEGQRLESSDQKQRRQNRIERQVFFLSPPQYPIWSRFSDSLSLSLSEIVFQFHIRTMPSRRRTLLKVIILGDSGSVTNFSLSLSLSLSLSVARNL